MWDDNMYKYEYVEVKAGFPNYSFEDSCVIIDDYANRGYRYAGYIPKEGGPSFYEIILIFEKKVDVED